MIATDPLSLVFLACAIFAGIFLVVSSLLGLGQTHGLHFGGHMSAHGVTAHTAPSHVHVGAHGGVNAHDAHTGATGAASPPSTAPLTALSHLVVESLNLYGALLFLLIFGLVGYLLHNSTNFGAVASLIVALLIGAVAAIISSVFLTRIFLANGSVTALDSASSQLEGRLGTVSVGIRAGGVGEIIYTGGAGSRQSMGAQSDDGAAIPVGTEVVILSYRDGIASVQPWDAFMVSARAGDAPQLTPLDIPS